MPAPIFATTSLQQAQRQVIKFGNNTIPVIGGTQPWADLNDGLSWFAQDVQVMMDHMLHARQQVWRSKGVWQSEDFGLMKIRMPTIFDEGGGQTFAAAKAALVAYGEQFLTFDNATQILAKCQLIEQPKILGGVPPYRFATLLEFWAKEPWFRDMSTSSVMATSVAGSGGAGTTTNVAVSAPSGSIFMEPQFILHIPGGNTQTVSQLKVKNLSSGELLTMNFSPVLPASTALDITIDSALFKVTNQNGVEYDAIGSFPMLYPGGAQSFAVSIVAAGGTTGFTFDIIWTPRWIP